MSLLKGKLIFYDKEYLYNLVKNRITEKQKK